MKIFGNQHDLQMPIALSDAVIIADPEELRALAEFFLAVADRAAEVDNGCPDHMHFRDHWGDWTDGSADIIAMIS